MFNESWQRPVWQIRWAPCWERYRELWRSRRRLRLKPEAQSRADQHLRQRVAKLCKGLSPFLFPLSLCLLHFLLSSSQHSIPHNSAVHSSAFSLTLPLACTDLWSEPTVMAKCQITPTFFPQQGQTQSEPTANS